MKRTLLKRKTRLGSRIGKFGAKRPLGRMKRRKTILSSSALEEARKRLWELCRQIIRKRYPPTCYTCGAPNLVGKNLHTGHCIPSSVGGVLLRYHLDNLRSQCSSCNIWKSGNSALFLRHLMDEIGLENVDELIALKSKTHRADISWYLKKIAEYELILSEVDNHLTLHA